MINVPIAGPGSIRVNSMTPGEVTLVIVDSQDRGSVLTFSCAEAKAVRAALLVAENLAAGVETGWVRLSKNLTVGGYILTKGDMVWKDAEGRVRLHYGSRCDFCEDTAHVFSPEGILDHGWDARGDEDRTTQTVLLSVMHNTD